MRSRILWLSALVLAAAMPRPVDAGALRAETPAPSVGSEAPMQALVPAMSPALASPVAPAPVPLTPNPTSVVACFNFDTNPVLNGGFLFIPPDPHGAAGLDHLVVIGNCVIEWRPKVGISNTPEFQSSLKDFFSALPGSPPGPGPGTTLSTTGFDPKVIYDQYRGRFVAVALELWRTAAGDPSNQSRILLAVSKTSNPNDGWWLHAIDAKIKIGQDHWVDYPGLACDDKAVYVTGNMYTFTGLGSYGGTRVWIINKTPAYDGPNNSAIATPYDPFTNPNAVGTSAQPTHMFGVLPNGSGGRPLGTFLVSYSGLTDGTDEYLQIVELTDPLGGVGGPFFTLQQLNVGDIEAAAAALPNALQLGSATTIATNDRRAQNAVWRDDNLYVCASYLPPAAPNANQTTARWWRLDTSVVAPGLTEADAGDAGGEDISVGAYTFFPSVMVDCQGNMALNFALSGPTVYPGAYYATRLAGDAAGTLGATCTLHAGTDWYNRTFGGGRNRWGDYSGISICPVDEGDFWVVNEYAMTRGTPTGPPAEDGRWQMVAGTFRLKTPTAVGDTPVAAARLEQNIPNPFNPTTTIRFELESRERVTLAVYDASGQLIRTLVNDTRGPGVHDVQWDGRSARGAAQASGVYFYRLTAGSFSESKKMVLLK